MGPKLFEDFFVFLGNCFCFCAFAWSEGTGGRDGGSEGGGFFLGKHKFPHIFDGFGAIPAI